MENLRYTIWSWDTGDPECWEDENGNPMSLDEIDALNSEYLEDERINLDKEVGTIICIGDIGLWNGRRGGYKVIGKNLSDILYSEMDGYCTWGVNFDNELVGEEAHHDGTNYYWYRVLKNGYTEDDLDDAGFSDEAIKEMTESLGDEVGKVYGWIA